MAFSVSSCVAPKLALYQTLRNGGVPQRLDSRSLVKCRGTYVTKMECRQSQEPKFDKGDTDGSPRNEDITMGLRRREILGLGSSVGVSLAMRTELSSAEEGSCELRFAPSGLGYCDIVKGTGIEASEGQLIKAHYTGKLENGKVFDSSYNRGKPLTFRVGVGEVIVGWDQGILGGAGIPPMLAGGKRTLKIPPELGYGVRGAGCKGGSCIIPPNSVLLFDVEFVGKA